MANREVLTKPELVQLLSGKGIEIGALYRPLVADNLDITYVDEKSTEEMCELYPELRAAGPVEVSIVDDGAVLKTIPDASQDFVIASHLIEHLPNPIAGMLTWQRVLKPGGRLFLVVPDKDQTFDKERALTTHEHTLLDWNDPNEERDFEHFVDFSLHVSCRTYDAAPDEKHVEYAGWLKKTGYSIHYHVWDLPTFRTWLAFLAQQVPGFGMDLIGESGVLPEEFAFVLQKR